MNWKSNICLTAIAASFVALSSCGNADDAVIAGQVDGAAGKTLYLDHIGGGNVATTDSLALQSDGKFRFTVRPESGPDFYSLRLGTQSFPIVVDTLHTPVDVRADAATFASTYTVSGRHNVQLHEAMTAVRELRTAIAQADRALSDGLLSPAAYGDTINTLVSAYKEAMLERYIYEEPSSPVAYYVLFQTVRGVPLFDPYDATDNRAFGAVATGWLFNYPQSPRVAHLEKVTKEGQVIRLRQRMRQQQADSTAQHIKESNFFDLSLPDLNDQIVTLASLVDGQSVIVLDFTAYFTPASVQHNQMLASLYDKYASRGLKIYQVCLDPDENFWKVSASRIPWTAVRDRDVVYDSRGDVQYSRPAAIYNVTNLPAAYVLGKDGSIEARVTSDEQLEREVQHRL